MSFDVLVTFSLACLLLSLSPGPSNLYIMARALSQGTSAGIAAAAGLGVGSLIFVLLSVVGLAALISVSPLLYTVLKLTGALYLVYLGVMHWRQHTQYHGVERAAKQENKASIFRQSITVELTNPKSALFFVAFLPQFTQQSDVPVAWQLTLLGVLYAFIAFVCDLMVANLAGTLATWLQRSPSVQLRMDQTSSIILCLLGVAILLEETHRHGLV